MDDPLLTRDEAARRLGLAPQTLAKWAHFGSHLTYLRIGNRCFYRTSVIERFLKSCERTSTSQPAPTSSLSNATAA